ncbi:MULTISPECIES: TOBE domain-containing protein [Ramlibacter]|uniref:TOBE domain-containing protein n=1 Tax=Ramlibacter aquaticus TaxID=2780094 RepID=A0ABR9SBF1_9BURK|nr:MULTISPECIES: TOBE domain-containing protein [Ramlibacter]MBE7939184.1 TOBE domain-containing protein [Ramlibacter aquaticus]
MSQPAQSGGLLSAQLRLAGRLDARFFVLLQAIHDSGSVHRAAGVAGLSHKGARLVLETASNLASEPLYAAATGGAGGGGTRLTPAGLELLAAWRRLEQRMERFLRREEEALDESPALAGLLRRMTMKTSARNQFAGTLTAVVTGPVSAEVSIALKSGATLAATLTAEAARTLGLASGQEALALVKASSVVLFGELGGWKLSARNQLAGTVARIEKGAVSCLVVLTLPGGDVISASVTHEGVQALGLRVAAPAVAVFPASAVLLAVRG